MAFAPEVESTGVFEQAVDPTAGFDLSTVVAASGPVAFEDFVDHTARRVGEMVHWAVGTVASPAAIASPFEDLVDY